ncbi:metal-dependent hydrolase [Thalassobacillus pellis]|uniref:metal-dependent hydrolase n=1 Tax=Thalassobacillus pellis TaxID=748008 RepID=UPI00195F63A3|nr:hypothetical protein [Thalassobacillus pellis]MBM7553545.1 hypothetical protein [Thalassobacillus pellis]
MFQIMIEHIPSSILHALTGALVMDIFFSSKDSGQKQHFTTMALGAIFVFTLDFPKLFGFVFTHSLVFVPFIGLVLAYGTRKLLNFSLASLWIGIMAVLLLGGITIDFIGNGAHLFYPFTEKALSFTLIKKDIWLIAILLFLVLFRLFNRRTTAVMAGGFLIIALGLGVKSYTKVTLENALAEKFSHTSIQQIITTPAPGIGIKWKFSIDTKTTLIQGNTYIGSSKILTEDIRPTP